MLPRKGGDKVSATSSLKPPHLTSIMNTLGFKAVDPFNLLNHVTTSFATVIEAVFAWVFFLSELAVLVGAIVFVAGAFGHSSKTKQMGAHMVLYAILGFFVAVVAPGAVMAINNGFHSLG